VATLESRCLRCPVPARSFSAGRSAPPPRARETPGVAVSGLHWDWDGRASRNPCRSLPGPGIPRTRDPPDPGIARTPDPPTRDPPDPGSPDPGSPDPGSPGPRIPGPGIPRTRDPPDPGSPGPRIPRTRERPTRGLRARTWDVPVVVRGYRPTRRRRRLERDVSESVRVSSRSPAVRPSALALGRPWCVGWR
jgi:hypothetical protein